MTKLEHRWTEAELSSIERKHRAGMSCQQVLDAFSERGLRLTEATFRKYVQMGLLPRSVRVGRKGARKGSQGLYPATVIRQIDRVRGLMAQGYTIEEIQRDFLFVNTEIESLERQLAAVFAGIEQAVERRAADGQHDPLAARALLDARETAARMVAQLREVETRLSVRARMAKAAV